MKATIFSLTALLALALAESTTTTTSALASTTSCAAEYIVDQCLTDTKTTQQNCNSTDYSCQCAAYQAEYTCFSNCPGDSRQGTYEGLVSQYCALASQYSTTNTVASSTAASTATSTGSADATTTGASSGTSTAESTASASATSGAGGAANLPLDAGGLLAAIAVSFGWRLLGM